MKVVVSKNNVPIRLTGERLDHIGSNHPELIGLEEDILDAISEPDMVHAGNTGELIALKSVVALNKSTVVVYRELNAEDRFVITAFLTSRIEPIKRRSKL